MPNMPKCIEPDQVQPHPPPHAATSIRLITWGYQTPPLGEGTPRLFSSRAIAPASLNPEARSSANNGATAARPAAALACRATDLPRDFHPALIRATAFVVTLVGVVLAMGSGMPDPIAKIVSA